MRKKVFTIEGVFQITGRGLVITGEKENKSFELRMKTTLIIVTPEGREINTKVVGIEMFSPPNFKVEAVSIGNFTEFDIPIGSTVFLDE